MRKIIYPIILILATTIVSCVISKNTTDKLVMEHVTNNTALVKEAAGFAVSITYDNDRREFLSQDIQDKRMREKCLSLGTTIYINYETGASREIPDSVVTFHSITVFGVTEILYDFATTERYFPDNTDNSKKYFFKKLADRIYYRRTPFPMM